MANMLDYMDWRGDITFDKVEINEIDALIFSQFSYLPLEGILGKGFKRTKTIYKIGQEYLKKYTDEEAEKQPPLLQNCRLLLMKMMQCDRFKDLRVCNYVAEFDPCITKQFAAVTICMDKEKYFVAYRGTDDSIAGWEEDFTACYMMPVASQNEAAKYLSSVVKTLKGEIYIGGHSKGGNLSLYAAMTEGVKCLDRIRYVYDFDGPGFLSEYVESEDYRKILPHVKSYNPQASVVGLILYRGDDVKIISSTEKGLLQHVAVSWEVIGSHFVEVKEYSKFSKMFAKANKKWIEGIDKEHRENFTRIVFSVLKSGSETVSGFKDSTITSVHSIFKTYGNLDKETKKMVREVINTMLKLGKETFVEDKEEKKAIVKTDKNNNFGVDE